MTAQRRDHSEYQPRSEWTDDELSDLPDGSWYPSGDTASSAVEDPAVTAGRREISGHQWRLIAIAACAAVWGLTAYVTLF